MQRERPSILIVDDDPEACEMLSQLLTNDCDFYDITTCTSFVKAFGLIRAKPYDLYIFDFLTPEITADEFCEMLRRVEPNTPIVIYSAANETLTRARAINAGADLYLIKPTDLDRICPSVKDLLDHRPAPTRGAA
jgi:DNA-binding response OmpR family regulator